MEASVESNVEFEEIFTDEHIEENASPDNQTIQNVPTEGECATVSNNGNSSTFGQQIASMENNLDYIEGVLGKETCADVIVAMNNLLLNAKPNSSVEAVIKFQLERNLFETQAESISSILQKCPKEMYWIGIPCLTVLIWKSGETLIYILVCVMICYIVHKLLSHQETAQRFVLKSGHVNMQLEALNQEGKLGQETALQLANKGKEIHQIRTDAVVKVSEINKEIVEKKLLALKAMQDAEIEGNMTITRLKEEGTTGREQLIQQTQENMITIKAAAEKYKAELLKETQVTIANLEMQKTQLKENTVREVKKIETDTQVAIEKMKGEAQQRQVQFETAQAAAERAHQLKVEEDRLRSQAENHRREVESRRDTDLKRIEAEMHNAREQTRQIEIQEQGKTARDKSSCSIQ